MNVRVFTTFVILLLFSIDVMSEVYEVGPGKKYLNISDVPLEKITAGDKVLIYYRESPYKEKWVITATGTDDKPVIFTGIPDNNGRLPIIDGRDATTREELNFWSEVRGIIKIGGSNNPADSLPYNIIIENLEIMNAHTPYIFTGKDGLTVWEKNSAAIFVEKGEKITIRNCIIHNNGNGIFVAHQSKNVLIESNYIYGNGNLDSIYEHNTYTEADGIIYQFNYFGPLMNGADGNNLKDRSAGTIIRYNYIESGNRQLDLVDSDYIDLISKEYYKNTYVYGNILVEPDGAGNSQILHYGGDSGNTENYRKGSLFFYNNNVISNRKGNTTLARLSTDEEKAYIVNNILFVSENGSRFAILDSSGEAYLYSNWIKTGYQKSHSNVDAQVIDEGSNLSTEPVGFINYEDSDYHLKAGSVCIDSGKELSEFVESRFYPDYEFDINRLPKNRFKDSEIDIGAFEFVKDIYDAGADSFDITAIDIQNDVSLSDINGDQKDYNDVLKDIYIEPDDVEDMSIDVEYYDIKSDIVSSDIMRQNDMSMDGYSNLQVDSGCSCNILM